MLTDAKGLVNRWYWSNGVKKHSRDDETFRYELYVMNDETYERYTQNSVKERLAYITVPRDYNWEGFFNTKCRSVIDGKIHYKHPEMSLGANFDLIGDFETYEEALSYYVNHYKK